MRELRELSKLPHDPDYWVELEARVLGRQGGRAAGRQEGDRAGWWVPLATRAGALSGLAIAAGVAALLLVPPRTRDRAPNPAGLLRLPDDPGMVAFLSAPEPPSLGSLLTRVPRSQP